MVESLSERRKPEELDRSILRREFRTFFESHGYAYKDSYPLLPHDDTSVLFINASATPFKRHLSGELPRLNEDVALIQKCLRVGSDTEAGEDTDILTFFEMLGLVVQNRSLDCVTADVISFITEKFFTLDRLRFTVSEDDQNSYNSLRQSGVHQDMIRKIKGNNDVWTYWNFGIPGIGGYGLTMIVDRGEKQGCGKEDCGVLCPCGRYKQLLNIIYIDEYHEKNRAIRKLQVPGVDVGCGLERLLALNNGVTSYECDPLNKIVMEAAKLLHILYGNSQRDDRRIRIIADQARSAVELVVEGILPGNKLQNYIVRKLIRRVLAEGYLLGASHDFLSELTRQIILLRGFDDLPQLEIEDIVGVIQREETETLRLFERSERIIKKMLRTNRVTDESSRNKFVEDMWSTYGVPREITRGMI